MWLFYAIFNDFSSKILATEANSNDGVPHCLEHLVFCGALDIASNLGMTAVL